MQPMTTNNLANLETITTEIKFFLGKAVQDFIEVGKRLITAKAMLPHGTWRDWLEDNFKLSQDTATNFMNIAKRFGTNSETFRNFSYSQLTALSKLPAADMKIFLVATAEAGNPAESLSVRDLHKAIKNWNEAHHKPRKSSTAETNITIVMDANITATSTVVPVRLPAEAIQLSLFDDLPEPLTAPKFLLPAEIIKAAKMIDIPCYLVTRAGHVDFPTPSIVVATATPLATWTQPLISKAAALIHCKQNFPTYDGRLKLKSVTILFFGVDVQTFASAFRFFGAALIPLK